MVEIGAFACRTRSACAGVFGRSSSASAPLAPIITTRSAPSSWTVTRESAASLGLASRFVTRVSHHDSDAGGPRDLWLAYRAGVHREYWTLYPYPRALMRVYPV